MTTRSSVNDTRLLQEASKFFQHGTWIHELIQNSYRAGATQLCVQLQGANLVFSDNGCGIADWDTVLELGGTKWDQNTVASQNPAGMGLFSLLLAHETTIKSHSVVLNTTPQAIAQSLELDLLEGPYIQGTSIIVYNCGELFTDPKSLGFETLHAALTSLLYTKQGTPFHVKIELPHFKYEGRVLDWQFRRGTLVREPQSQLSLLVDQDPFCDSAASEQLVLAIPAYITDSLYVTFRTTKAAQPKLHLLFHGRLLQVVEEKPRWLLEGILVLNTAITLYPIVQIFGNAESPIDLQLPHRDAPLFNDKWVTFMEQLRGLAEKARATLLAQLATRCVAIDLGQPHLELYARENSPFKPSTQQPGATWEQGLWHGIPTSYKDLDIIMPAYAFGAEEVKIPITQNAWDEDDTYPAWADRLPKNYWGNRWNPFFRTAYGITQRLVRSAANENSLRVGYCMYPDQLPDLLKPKVANFSDIEHVFEESLGSRELRYNDGTYRLHFFRKVGFTYRAQTYLIQKPWIGVVPSNISNNPASAEMWANQAFKELLQQKPKEAVIQLVRALCDLYYRYDQDDGGEWTQEDFDLAIDEPAILQSLQPLSLANELHGSILQLLRREHPQVLPALQDGHLHIKSLRIQGTTESLRVVIEGKREVWKGLYVDGDWEWERHERKKASPKNPLQGI